MASFVDVVPALGRGLEFAQGFPGGYDAIDLRRAHSVGRQEGAVTAGAYKVTQRSAGANLSVDVATDQGAFLVQGDDVALQGLYQVAATALKSNLDVAAANVTNPRVDQVVVEARDDAHKGDGITRARVYVLTGTPTSGATLDNAAGTTSRAALPPSTARLAEFVVAAGATSIASAAIRDRRGWAAGGYRRVARSTNATGGIDYPATNGPLAFTAVDSANLAPRMECSGAPVRLHVFGQVTSGVAGAFFLVHWRMDGQPIDGGGDGTVYIPDTGNILSIDFTRTVIPPAGSHVFAPYITWVVGQATLLARVGQAVIVEVEEVVRPVASNG